MRPLLTRIVSASLLLVLAGLFLTIRTGATAATLAEAPAQAKPAPDSPNALCPSFSNYLVYTNTGVSLVPGTLDIGNHTDDGITGMALPFPYTLYDQTFTSVNASSNGNLQFSTANVEYANICLPYTSANFAIYPYWDDLITTCVGCGIYTSTSGSAPNRIFNIEWRAQTLNAGFTTNFEVRLYEGRTQFEFIYGTVGGSGNSATVGVQRDTGSRITQFSCDTGGLSSGMQQVYILPSCTACSTGDYTIASSRGATVVPGTTRVDGTGCDDCAYPVAMPFAYTLYDQSYTTINVSTNGNTQFASNFADFSNTCLPYSPFNFAILPYWDDLDTRPAGDGIYTSTSGSAPNRIFNIEWRAHMIASGLPVNFELRLYEGTTYFEVVYGAMADNGSGATVGVQRATGNRFTQYECNTAGTITGNLRLSFNLVCPPVPTATPTATNTHTRTYTTTPSNTPTPCVVQTPLNEGFESGTLNTFSSFVPTCVPGGCGWASVNTAARTGTYSAFSPDVANIADQLLTTNSPIALPASGLASASLNFWHRFTFEGSGANYYDGAVLETSTNSGVSWQDAGANITSGGYNGTIAGGFNNPLAGRPAWGQVSTAYPAFSQVVVNLLPYAGQTVLFRFRQGDDISNGSTGWWIDDVVVTLNYSACVTPTPSNTLTPDPCAPAWAVIGSPNAGAGDNQLKGIAAVSANDVWAVGYYNNGGTLQTLIQRWNGASWSVVASPNVGTSHNELLGVAAVSANDVWAVGYSNNGSTSQTLVMRWNGTSWSVVASPNVGPASNAFTGVAAVSANDVWAVGYYYNGGTRQTLIERWNGTSWSVVASPNQGAGDNLLLGVAAVSANDVWAVGWYRNGINIAQTLIERWNGTSWSVVASPNVGTGDNQLNGVAAVSANDVWAVGYYRTSGGISQTLIERWNGTSWSVVASPNVGTSHNEIKGVAAVSANDVWAVGYYDIGSFTYQTLIQRWNGTSWQMVSSPNQGASLNILNGVAKVTANDVWAVGYYYTGSTDQTLVEHYATLCGTPTHTPTRTFTRTFTPTATSTCDPVWSVVSSPNQGTSHNQLNGVAAVSANDVWAVGFYESGSTDQTLIQRWNGTSWQVVSSPNVGTNHNRLYGIAVVSANDVWAVGWYWNGSSIAQTLVLHWNGTSWQVVSCPNPGGSTRNNVLNGVAAVSANDVWAVGYYDNGSGIQQTLIEHWNGASWQVVSSPNQGTSNNVLNGVAAVSASDVWAVGYYLNGSTNQTLTLHWNGTSWSVVSSPNPSGSNNELNGVAAVSANDVWAVGIYYNGSIDQTLTLRWNGTSWQVVSSPNVGTGNRLQGAAAVSANDVWAVGTYFNGSTNQTLALHWNSTSWQVVVSPNVGTSYNELNGVAAVSANDVWAVGVYVTVSVISQTLVEHYASPCTTPTLTPTQTRTPTATATCDPAWTVVSSPNQGTSANRLYEVAVVSANDVWAVGYYLNGSLNQTLIQHWDGTSWQVVSSPNPGTGHNYLLGVAAVSANDVWAVGYYDSGGVNQTLIMCWNGTSWQVVASPSPGTGYNQLNGVVAVSATDVWAVGYYCTANCFSNDARTLTLRWNGTSWSVVASPNVGTESNYLNGVAVVSANDVWAVGYYHNGTVDQTLIQRWNGTSWSVVGSLNVGAGNNVLFGVSALSANNVWAVGRYGTFPNSQTLVEHWNGLAWTVVSSPNVAGFSTLESVSALSANDVWAAGYYCTAGCLSGDARTLIEHWNGTSWQVIPSPNPGTLNDYLNGVAAVSANDVWAVGMYSSSGVPFRTLAARYTSPCVSPTFTRTASPTNTRTNTPTITPTPTRTNTPANTPTITLTPTRTNTPTITPTGAITNTPTPTGTVAIVGHVTWQGRPAQPNALQQLPVTFSIGITSTVLNFGGITTDSRGFFTVTARLYPGTYTSRAIGPKYLANRAVFTVTTASQISVELGLMKAGDANGDNVINVNDFNILRGTFGKSAGDPGYDARADFTGDNLVSITDFNLLKGNFGLSGSPPCSNGVCPP